jgi:hypothetical protein
MSYVVGATLAVAQQRAETLVLNPSALLRINSPNVHDLTKE